MCPGHEIWILGLENARKAGRREKMAGQERMTARPAWPNGSEHLQTDVEIPYCTVSTTTSDADEQPMNLVVVSRALVCWYGTVTPSGRQYIQ
jgi:hypothetical protein